MATAETMIDEARAYVGTLKGEMAGALNQARGLVYADGAYAMGYLGYDTKILGVTRLPEPPELPARPEFPTIDLALNPPPGPMVALDVTPTYRQMNTPQFTAPVPVYEAPDKPTLLEPFGDEPLPMDLGIEFPLPPSELSNPTLNAPEFDQHSMPEKAKLLLPDLPSEVPENDAVAPTNLAVKFVSDVRSNIATSRGLASSYVDEMITKFAPQHNAGMSALESRLQKYLDGGTALSPEVEKNIYDRGRAKNDDEAIRVQEAALVDVAARGFTMPNGVLASMMNRARRDAANNNAKMVNEIAIAQAEMEQKNLQFAVTSSAALRTTVLNLTQQWLQGLVALNGQAVDSAKAVLSALIETYNTSVKAYSVKLDAWKAEAALFDSKVKVELAKAEIYKTEISALLAEYSVDQMKIDLYKAEVSSLMSLAEMYKGQVAAVAGKVSMEKLKIDLFQSQVQAYGAQVQQKQAEWQGFSASVGGFSAEAQAYSARVNGYSAQVSAFKADIDAKVGEIQATTAKNQATADGYKGTIAGYVANVQGLSTSNSANIESLRQTGALFKAELDYGSTKYASNLGYYRAESDRVLAEAKVKFDVLGKKAEMATEQMKAAASIGERLGAIQGGMAQAALAGMNVLASKITTE